MGSGQAGKANIVFFFTFKAGFLEKSPKIGNFEV
jgi:hypothetical protein